MEEVTTWQDRLIVLIATIADRTSSRFRFRLTFWIHFSSSRFGSSSPRLRFVMLHQQFWNSDTLVESIPGRNTMSFLSLLLSFIDYFKGRLRFIVAFVLFFFILNLLSKFVHLSHQLIQLTTIDLIVKFAFSLVVEQFPRTHCFQLFNEL